MRQTTIKDLAKHLGLSVSTVSRALRDHPDIAGKTKKRVANAARQFDYQPNTLAQSLQSKTSRTIGIIVPEIRHDFFASAISAIEKVANEAGYFVIISQTGESYQHEVLNARALMEHRVAGMVVSISQETEDFEHFRSVMRRGVPVVFFDRAPEELEASKVVVDDRHGAHQATTHLIERGYKRIAHIAGPKNISIGRERLRGYREALTDKGMEYDPALVIDAGFMERDGAKAMRELLEKAPGVDAVFCANDPVAIGAFRYLREKGIAIPGQVALVGFSNNPVTGLIDPALTTVDQPTLAMGETAAQLLLEQIRAGRQASEREREEGRENTVKVVPETRVLGTELIVRQSS